MFSQPPSIERVLRMDLEAAPSVPLALPALHDFLVRYVFYAFVFSVPFEAVAAQFTGMLQNTIAKAVGLILTLLTLCRPHKYYRHIPRPLFLFLIYLSIYLVYAALLGQPLLSDGTVTMIQLLVLFYLSYNIMLTTRVRTGMLYSLVLSCTVLAVLQAVGLTAEQIPQGRISAVGENANTLSAVLSMGLIAVTGLAFGRGKATLLSRIFFASSAFILIVQIVRTGSRASAIALAASLLVFVLKKARSILPTLKMAAVASVVVCVLAVLSFRSEAIRERWTASLERGSLAGREEIFPIAWGMFLEKPGFGWGPTAHLIELGHRLGLPIRDPHNVYLWILNEVGITGAIFFFGALLWCLRASWKARSGTEGILPFAMLLCMLIVNSNGSYHYHKLFWLTLAYALAGARIASKSMQNNLSGVTLSQYQ